MTPAPPAIPHVILGVPFHAVTHDQAVATCLAHIRRRKPGYVTTPNLDFLMRASRDPELQRILTESDLVIADGMPIVWLSRLLGPRLPERVAGSDLVVSLARAAAAHGLSVFHLGGAPGVPEKAGAALAARFPGFRLAGAYSPPLADLLNMNQAEMLARLAQANPDILYVAFGAPKQEKWINMHVRQWQVPLALGIGGSLDFLAGTQRRAPRWMQRAGLEWIWRFGTHPRRFGQRYGANLLFLARAVWRILYLKCAPLGPTPAQLPPPAAQADFQIADWRPVQDAAQAQAAYERLTGAPGDQRTLLINLTGCVWLNSLELGLLLSLGRQGRQAERPVLYTGAARRVRRGLTDNGLDNLLTEVPPPADWTALRAAPPAARATVEDGGASLRLTTPRELTAASLPAWRALVTDALAAPAERLREVQIDAAELRFLDSAALGYLLALKQELERAGRRFVLCHCHGPAQRTLRLARVEEFLTAPATPGPDNAGAGHESYHR